MTLRASTRWAVLAASIAVLLLILSSTASAAPMPVGPAPALYAHSKPVSQMTLREKEQFQLRALKHYRSVVRSFLAWRKANLLTVSANVAVDRALAGAVPLTMCKTLGVTATSNVCWYAQASRWTQRELAETRAVLRKLSMSGDVCVASKSACAWYADGATQCEVAHEGAFTTNTGNGYYGRFQMDLGFQQSTSYGRRAYALYGTADRWPPSVQIEHAYEVWTVRGWNPWPPYSVYGCAAWHGRVYTG